VSETESGRFAVTSVMERFGNAGTVSPCAACVPERRQMESTVKFGETPGPLVAKISHGPAVRMYGHVADSHPVAPGVPMAKGNPAGDPSAFMARI
jgi:hypothetical protein